MFPILAGSNPSGYNLTRSLRFRSSASAYLNRTPATTTNRKTFTWSGWVKRGSLSAAMNILNAAGGALNGNDRTYITFNSDNTLSFVNAIAGAYQIVTTSAVFRDPSAWYHIVVSVDSTQATAANRTIIYVNGVSQALTGTYITQNNDTYINSATIHRIAAEAFTVTNLFDGYLTEVNFIDGQALTPSSFGSTNTLTGVWQPARYTGTYGTNGFYLPFTDNSALTTSSNVGLGKDFSGNSNYFTTNNISITAGVTYDSMTDVPTLTSATAANYCVYNPLNSYAGVLFAANLGTYSATAAWFSSVGTIYVNSGKWYAEVTVTSHSVASIVGIVNTSFNGLTSQYVGISAGSYSYANDGVKYNNGTGAAYGATYTNGDVIGVALNMDAGTITFYKNNVSQGVAFTGLTGLFAFGVSVYQDQLYSNFGQFPFTYTPPTGFVALNTFNIAAGTVTTSGSFTGNLSADGPFVYLNGVPTAMTINGNAVTFGTQADKLANGFKVRTASALYNLATANTYSVTTNGAVFKNANAQGNP